jgi:hypothetical protein
MRKMQATAWVALIIIFCSLLTGYQTVLAQHTPDGKPCPLASGITINSPTNRTYGAVLPPLNISLRGFLNPATYRVEAVYCIDENQNITIPMKSSFVPVTSTITYASGITSTGVSSLFSFYLFTGNTPLQPLPDGAHTLTVYANYTCINKASGNNPDILYINNTVHFSVNSGIPPAISNISTQNQTYHQSNITLNFAINKPTAWIGYNLDGQGNVTLSGNTTLSLLTNGAHTVTVYANDTVGNMASETAYFEVDVPAQNSELMALEVGVLASAAVMIVLLIVYFKKRN